MMKRTISMFVLCALLLTLLAVPAFAASPVAVSFSTAVPVTAQSLIQLQGSDPDGTPLTFANTTSPAHGTLSQLNAATGAVVYTPTAGYTGADSFQFTVSSGGDTSGAATVTITVTAGKTRIVDTLTNPDESPRAGKVSFFLTQVASAPSGVVPAKASVSATLNASGQFDLTVYPSRAVSPVQYYQVWFDDALTNNTQLIGIYDIPASTTSISLSGHRITDANLAAQFTFASKAEVDALTQAVAAAVAAQVFPGLTTGRHILWNGITFANSLISESGSTVTVNGNLTVNGTITGPISTSLGQLSDVHATGATEGQFLRRGPTQWENSLITGADIPSLDASKITTGQISNARTTATSSNTANTIVARDENGNFNAGVITAGAFVGNGSGLTGIGTGTGGVINTGSTTIGADSGATGVGKISLQTQGQERLSVENDGTIKTPGGIIVTDRGGIVYDVRAFGAKCDRVGETGTDDTAAIQRAINAAQLVPGLGEVLISGQCMVRKATPGGYILTVTKGITMRGQGGWSVSGIYASTDTPDTVDILAYKPTGHPDNEGFTLRGFTIASSGMTSNLAFPGAWNVSTPSARHALVLDDTATSGNVAIRKVTIENMQLGMTTLSSGGGKGLVATNSNVNGNPAQSVINNNHIWNGVYLPGAGDTVSFTNNTMMGQNTFDVTQTAGATTLKVDNNNITYRGGIHIGAGKQVEVTNNILEEAFTDAVGSHGALIDLDGSTVLGAKVDGNVMADFGPSAPLNGIRVNNATGVSIGFNNTIFLQGGATGIQQIGSNFTYYNEPDAGNAPAISATNNATAARAVYASLADPGSTFGFKGFINMIGYLKSVGATGQEPKLISNLVDQTLRGHVVFQDNGTDKATLTYSGPSASPAARQQELALINETSTGSVGIYTNNQGRVFVNSAGVFNWYKGANVTVASTITPTGNSFVLSGTGTISTIDTTGITPGTTLQMIASGSTTFNESGNIDVTGATSLTVGNGDLVITVWDGSKWRLR